MITARTDEDKQLYETGVAFLDWLEELHTQYSAHTISDFAMPVEPIRGINTRVPDEVRDSVTSPNNASSSRWARGNPDFADWRVIVAPDESGTHTSCPPLRDWVQTDPDTPSALEVAVSAFESLYAMDVDAVTAEGLWVPHSQASDAEYQMIVTATDPLDGRREHRVTVTADTMGNIETRLELGYLQTMEPIPIFDMPLATPSDGDAPPVADELSQARDMNWTRTILGSHAWHISEQTTLSYTEALVHLLDGRDDISSDSEIADYIGRSPSSIGTLKMRVREKFDEAYDNIEENRRTLDVVARESDLLPESDESLDD